MTRIFIYERIPAIPLIPEVYPIYGREDHYTKNQVHLASVFDRYTEPFFTQVNSPTDADFILYPHFYREVRTRAREHLEHAVSFSKEAQKPLILSAYGDSDELIELENTIVLRYSQYRHSLRKNEIIIPPYAADTADVQEPQPRQKHQGPPVVGFCGRAEYSGFYSKLRATIKNIYIEIRTLTTFNPTLRARKGSIYFRKRMLEELQKSPLIKTNFIVRDFFSLNTKTALEATHKLRLEFVENMMTSDFSATIKGDANAATRFFEALAFNRILIVFDTDTLFPLEDIIPYRDFCLFIPYTKIPQGGEIIAEYYGSLLPEVFVHKQQIARQVFTQYLRADAFYRFLFSRPGEIRSRVTL